MPKACCAKPSQGARARLGAIRLRPSWAAGDIKSLPSARYWRGKQARGFG